MPEYEGVVRKRARSTTIILVVCVLGLMVWEVFVRNYLYLTITLFVLFACLLKKSHIVSEKGVTIRYLLLGREVNSCWVWEEVTAVMVDYGKASPDVMVYFGKGLNTRAFRFESATATNLVPVLKRLSKERGLQFTMR